MSANGYTFYSTATSKEGVRIPFPSNSEEQVTPTAPQEVVQKEQKVAPWPFRVIPWFQQNTLASNIRAWIRR
jgi:hypothetical protein